MESCSLVSKFGWTEADVQSALRSYLVEAKHVTIRGDVSACRDPKDDMVFECAVRASADIIVSGDKDILAIGEYKGIPHPHGPAILSRDEC